MKQSIKSASIAASFAAVIVSTIDVDAGVDKEPSVSDTTKAGELSLTNADASASPEPPLSVPNPNGAMRSDADIDNSGAGGREAVDAGANAIDSTDAGRVWASCIEFVPDGAVRPKLTATFPARGFAGHALPLRVLIEHGLGETVFPSGFRVQSDSDAGRAIADAGFFWPDSNGGSPPHVNRRDEHDRAITEVEVNFLSLPSEPGRHELTLPPIPIAVSRASGEFLTLCTPPHAIIVDEPIVDAVDAMPVGNPPPRRQRETWVLARDLAYGALIGAAIVGAITAFAVWWRRRPKRPVLPPPPRPPWEVAMESLDQIRREHLVAQGKLAEHVDKVSDIVRVYLGSRFGFDGIESTTEEVLHALLRVPSSAVVYHKVGKLLQHSDLVKFARWMPSSEACEQVVVDAESIVRTTVPSAEQNSTQLRSDAPSLAPPVEEQGPTGGSVEKHRTTTESQHSSSTVVALESGLENALDVASSDSLSRVEPRSGPASETSGSESTVSREEQK